MSARKFDGFEAKRWADTSMQSCVDVSLISKNKGSITFTSIGEGLVKRKELFQMMRADVKVKPKDDDWALHNTEYPLPQESLLSLGSIIAGIASAYDDQHKQELLESVLKEHRHKLEKAIIRIAMRTK